MTSLGDAVFRTLADPTRRHILDLLAEAGPLTVSELSDEFPRLVTSSISKHLMSAGGGFGNGNPARSPATLSTGGGRTPRSAGAVGCEVRAVLVRRAWPSAWSR